MERFRGILPVLKYHWDLDTISDMGRIFDGQSIKERRTCKNIRLLIITIITLTL